MEQAVAYQVESSDLFVLADRLQRLKQEKQEEEEHLKRIEKQIEETEELMVQQMLAEEIGKFSRSGRTFYVYTRTFASPVADRKEELFKWLRTNGYESLVYETVNSNSLSACVKEMLEEAEELPAELKELVNVYEKQRIGVQKTRR